MYARAILTAIFFCLLGCSPHRIAPQCSHTHSPYIIFLVDARGLDYSSPSSLLRTIAKHPSDGSKNGDVGHAWFSLHGDRIIEGGHSGEFGIVQSRYWEGVLERSLEGDPNSIDYLWCTQKDGVFQKGSGGHMPTYAAKVNLSQDQYRAILSYIHPEHYDYSNYSLTGNQCSSFLVQIAQIIGIELQADVTVTIPSQMTLYGRPLYLWEDPIYSELTFSSPDELQKSLRRTVARGEAEDVLKWHRKTHKRSIKQRFAHLVSEVKAFSERYRRYQEISAAY